MCRPCAGALPPPGELERSCRCCTIPAGKHIADALLCQVKLNGGKELLDLNASLVELKLSAACLEPFVPCTDEAEQAQVPCPSTR